MQVEHKTEKGVILFVKVPEVASNLTQPKVGMVDLYFQTKIKSKDEEDNHISVTLPDVGFQLIALTTDITEEQAEMMVGIGEVWGSLRLFKSLMQHLQVYEVNPFDEFECTNQWCEDGYINQGYGEKWRCDFCQENEYKQHDSQSRTGKWVVLFKPD